MTLYADKQTVAQWLFSGNIKKIYDRSVKGNVFDITDQRSKIQLPQDVHKTELFLTQPYLNLQVKVMNKKEFHVEVTFTGQDRLKKRLIFFAGQQYTYSKDNIQRRPMHARIPTAMILQGVWLNLQFDIQSFVEKCFDVPSFRTIDSISVSGSALVKRVFMSKYQVPDSFPHVLEQEFSE